MAVLSAGYISYAGLEQTVSLIASRCETETRCIISFGGMTYGYGTVISGDGGKYKAVFCSQIFFYGADPPA